MADESMQMPPDENDSGVIALDSEIPVRIETLEADGVRPSMGDTVTLRVEGTVKSIENDCVYVTPEKINDDDLAGILAEHADAEGNEDSMMERLTAQADQTNMQRWIRMIIRYREINGRVVKDVIPRTRLRGEERPPVHFSETLMKAHYALECEQGSRYRSGYPKTFTKRVLDTSMARDGAL